MSEEQKKIIDAMEKLPQEMRDRLLDIAAGATMAWEELAKAGSPKAPDPSSEGQNHFKSVSPH